MLLLSNAPGNENPQMADAFVDRVDNSLAIRTNFIDAPVKIQNPSQRLLRRRNVVALEQEHHDRRADVAQIDG